MFESLDDAKAACDQVVYVDLSRPERNGAPNFMMWKTNDIRAPNNKELISTITMKLHHLMDLRDFQKHKVKNILGGTALYAELPIIPHTATEEKEIDDIHSKEKERCARTEEAYKVAINELLENEDLWVFKILFIMPDGMVCNADLNAELAPHGDQKVKLAMRKGSANCTLGRSRQVIQQEFHPGKWTLRVVSEPRRTITRTNNDMDEDF